MTCKKTPLTSILKQFIKSKCPINIDKTHCIKWNFIILYTHIKIMYHRLNISGIDTMGQPGQCPGAPELWGSPKLPEA